MIPDLWTYKDAIDHAQDYTGGTTDGQSDRFARRAIQLAYNEMQSQKNWDYYFTMGQIVTVEPYMTGTVTYDHTGGAYNRLVTLTGGTWPSWASDGILAIENVAYQAAQRIDDTRLVLSDGINPGNDISDAKSFTLYRDTYPMPLDFGSVGNVIIQGRQAILNYMTTSDMMELQVSSLSPAQPAFYTFMGDVNRFESLSIRFHPVPNLVFPIKFTYRRRPRQMRIDLYDAGTVSTTSGSTTVTGAGTNWNSSMVGSLIRFSSDGTNVPTGISGASPFWLERSIVGFTNANTLTLDADPQQTLTNVKHSISDPVDIESGAMLPYFLREVERQMRIIRRMKPTPDEDENYRLAMMSAMEADSRVYGSRAVFNQNGAWRRMASCPVGPDIT